MTATVTHQPKAGATLTGAEYEATDHHVISIAAADIGAAAAGHNHDATYATTGHTHASYAASDHNHNGTYAASSHTHAYLSPAKVGARVALGV